MMLPVYGVEVRVLRPWVLPVNLIPAFGVGD